MGDKVREWFERAFMDIHGQDWQDVDPFSRLPCGDYFFPGVECEWKIWQAAASHYAMDGALLDDISNALFDSGHDELIVRFAEHRDKVGE